MRGTCSSSVRWWTALASGLGAPSGPSFWANAGSAATTPSSIAMIVTRRRRANSVIDHLVRRLRLPLRKRRSKFVGSALDVLVIGRFPAPGAGAIAARVNPLFVDLRDDVAVASQQGFGRAHLGAHGQLPFAEAVRAVLFVFLGAARRFRPAAARAIG